MKKPRPSRPKAIKERAAQTAAVMSPSSSMAAEAPKKKSAFNPFIFLQEVRAEARKITWTTPRETWVTAVMVFIMVAITAAFFFVLDKGLSFGMAGLFALATPGA